jgi:predicted metal-dependent phosphoesterase TrpH
MSTTIEETVRTSLRESGREGYFTYAEPVVRALVDRERAISETLMAKGEEQLELDREEIADLLSEAGLSVPVQAPIEQVEGNGEGQLGRIEHMLTSLTERIESLTTFARRNGYSG